MTAPRAWHADLPRVLVVACSDGRFQEAVDAFVRDELGVRHYDRLSVPGGAGALATSGSSFSRAHDLREECRFLVTAHAIEQVVFVFHGAAPDGPATADCADYGRKMPGSSSEQIRAQQDEDMREVARSGATPGAELAFYRCEVGPDEAVHFVPLSPE